VHGESYCGAHRLPAGKTAAKKRERGRRAGQAVKLFESRLLLVSKAWAPFVKTANFRHSGKRKSTCFVKRSKYSFVGRGLGHVVVAGGVLSFSFDRKERQMNGVFFVAGAERLRLISRAGFHVQLGLIRRLRLQKQDAVAARVRDSRVQASVPSVWSRTSGALRRRYTGRARFEAS
jgi:hypothetical protein